MNTEVVGVNKAQLDRLLDVASLISRGGIPEYEQNECFAAGAFDLLLIKVRDGEAFQLLCDVCGRYLEWKASGADMGGYYLLLSLLARQSNTTEMPAEMPTIIKERPALSGDLKEWYRFEG